MQFNRSIRLLALFTTIALLLSGSFLLAQETTGGLQGTVRDASGAVVSNAHGRGDRLISGRQKDHHHRHRRILSVCELAPRHVQH